MVSLTSTSKFTSPKYTIGEVSVVAINEVTFRNSNLILSKIFHITMGNLQLTVVVFPENSTSVKTMPRTPYARWSEILDLVNWFSSLHSLRQLSHVECKAVLTLQDLCHVPSKHGWL